MLTLPFVHLNLRFNPFGERPWEEYAAFAVPAVAPPAPGECVQVLGDAGRGKTTHLLSWSAHFAGAVYEYVPEGADRIRTRLWFRRAFFLDEAQRIRRADLRRAARVETLVLGTHEDLSAALGRPVRTIRVGGVEPGRIAEILRRRVEHARRGPGPVPEFPSHAIAALERRFGDDLRSMRSHLYDVFERLEGPGHVEV